jgi:hypothetical protein
VSARVGARGPLGALKRTLAIALLPASILPVLVFGPGIVRAPGEQLNRVLAALQRLEQSAPAKQRQAVLQRRPLEQRNRAEPRHGSALARRVELARRASHERHGARRSAP